MRTLDFNSVLRNAILAGLLAAVAVALFHSVVTEPVIDAAIAIEEARMPAHEMAAEEPVVSRDIQRIGLLVGVPLYGMAVGILFCMAFYLLQRLMPAVDPVRQAAVLGLIGYWGLALGPFLKYPANPPGVGDPETIQARVFMDLLFKALLIAGAAVSLYASRRMSVQPWMLVAANLAFGAVLFAVMPANTDPVEMPAGLMLQFRALSLVGLTLLWALLTGLFVWQLRRGMSERSPGQALPRHVPA